MPFLINYRQSSWFHPRDPVPTTTFALVPGINDHIVPKRSHLRLYPAARRQLRHWIFWTEIAISFDTIDFVELDKLQDDNDNDRSALIRFSDLALSDTILI